MKLSPITTALVCIALLMFTACIALARDIEQQGPGPDGRQQPAQEKKEGASGLELLKKAEKISRELAEDYLPKQKVGGETQDKEEEVIKAFDDLIQLILDQQAEKEAEKQQQQKSQQQQSGEPGGQEPATMQGKVSDDPSGKTSGSMRPGGIFGDGKKKDEWGFLPDKDFDPTTQEDAANYPPGYKRLIERYRAVFNRELSRIRR